MGMLHVAAGDDSRKLSEIEAPFNGFEVMRLEIISEGANRILKGPFSFFSVFLAFFFFFFYQHLAAVQ